MRVCERCRGFVPESVADCPHCTSAGRMLAKIAALTIGAGFVIAISIPGCAYGCPDGTCGAWLVHGKKSLPAAAGRKSHVLARAELKIP